MQIGGEINTHHSQSDEDQPREGKDSSKNGSRFNQTIKTVKGLFRGHSMPDKVSITRKSDELTPPSPDFQRSWSASETRTHNPINKFVEEDIDGNIDSLDAEVSSSNPNSASIGARATDSARVANFNKELEGTTVVLERLRELSWSGIPPYMRPKAWRLLLGYAPCKSDRRERVLGRKRLEYLDCVSNFYDRPDTERSEDEITMLHQIAMDCPRTVPSITLFQQEQVQKSLERILFAWAIRHPAMGYVQGINYLVTPFLVVFLSEYIEGSIDNWSMDTLSPHKNSEIEADCYWCLSKLLDGMQDNYTFAQPGIQRLVFKLKELVRRIDEPVSRHMEEQGLEFLQFSFRWFNCLLLREIPFHLVIRLWDTYLAEGDALPDFLVYIYASFLLTWSDQLKELEFLEMVMFLQHLPTQNWSHHELETVLSRAYIWHSVFNSSPHHLVS